MEEGKKSLIAEIENILKNQSKDLKQDEGLNNIFCHFFCFFVPKKTIFILRLIASHV